jgi:hypothetical protein
MAVAAAVSLYLQIVVGWDSDRPRDFAYLMIVTVGITTVAWVATTLMTKPEPQETLDRFYARVDPMRGGWPAMARQLVNVVLGCVLVYAALFGVGELLLGSVPLGVALLALSAVAAAAIARNLPS